MAHSRASVEQFIMRLRFAGAFGHCPRQGRIQRSMLASFKGPFDRLRAGPQRGPGAKTRVSARNERLPWGKVKLQSNPSVGCGLHGLQPPALVAAPDGVVPRVPFASDPGHNPVGVATASSADPGLLVPRNPGLCDRTPLAFCWQETLRQAQGRASSGRDYPDSSVSRNLLNGDSA